MCCVDVENCGATKGFGFIYIYIDNDYQHNLINLGYKSNKWSLPYFITLCVLGLFTKFFKETKRCTTQ